MSRQPITKKQTPASQNAGIVAILFFLAGAPHIYSFLKRRSQQGASLGALGMKILGLLGTGTIGAIAVNAL
ncbi:MULTISPECIES: hypothetical protein [Cyanophyceae]|uniref:hypothetical protein n=1 Tax=Cyanophyceae TaxID=3028117 RepID=UPI0004AA134F|nr:MULTISPECIES: hypothetical protein [Cyanophyceae]AMA09185.1 hypothetical protein AWQ23_07570 [Picosynechococcus sp. PCC 73109]ANV87331.1 hypothetical protein AWQ22_07590 [Picosynechococcus sp. PCC 7117]QCS50029.1 hypothetical protein FEK30_11620 [Picosynechococcus sp. PCC 11901]